MFIYIYSVYIKRIMFLLFFLCFLPSEIFNLSSRSCAWPSLWARMVTAGNGSATINSATNLTQSHHI